MRFNWYQYSYLAFFGQRLSWPLQIYGKKGSRPSNHASNDTLTIWNPFKLAMFCSRYAKTSDRISIRPSTSASSHTSGGRKRSV